MVKGQIKYHRTYLKLHREWEVYAYLIVKQALDEQMVPVVSWIATNDYDTIESYLDYLLSTAPMTTALLEIYPTVGSSAARFNYAWLGAFERKALVDFFNAEWIKQMTDYFLLHAGAKIRGITDTTIKEVRRVIAEARAQNLSRRAEARYITDTLKAPEFNRSRALTIARTESTTAANHGIILGAESSDYVVNKQWLATLDKRTRKDHMQANGQEAQLLQPFYVGGVPMQQPGDPTAPADQCVNCRCVMLTVPVLDADGLPVLKVRMGMA